MNIVRNNRIPAGNLVIRPEEATDYRAVEELTREAFWNLYVPGCSEHHVAHVMRDHPDFVGELDFVATFDGRLVGNIMYTRSFLLDESGVRLDTLTFGPVCVHPDFQYQGIGTALIGHTVNLAREQGAPAIIILGHPHNYCRHGFRNSKDMRVANRQGRHPFGLLILELVDGVLAGHDWRFFESEVYDQPLEAVEAFDAGFEPKEKAYRYSQEEFAMACRAFLE